MLLAALLIAFIVSFLTGLGDGEAAERLSGDAARGGQQLDRIGPRIRVEVLNAAGVAGLARQAMQHLRERGFDVVYIGNAGSFEQDSTVVVARTADVDAARRVARALGTDSVVVDPDPQLYVDATVRLGRNWPRTGESPGVDEGGMVGRLKGWVGADSAGTGP
ncbi:MAG TPA: LytR C-terminal domain-containing protein [Longimicrobiales bacterium]|nr:LytR C-terminal domain-containing protein [Longimicrobiales bacterium]